jgi:hypothetical protein
MLDGCRDRLSCYASFAGGAGWEAGIGTGRDDRGRAAVSGGAGRAGAFLNLETMIGAAFGALAFGDPFGVPHVGGGVAILLGIALSASADVSCGCAVDGDGGRLIRDAT